MSHETIYRSLFIQARGALKKELLDHLRRTRGMRRSRHYTQKTEGHGQIVDAVSISERHAEGHDRAVPGHWEGDLLMGSHNSQIATLVERSTRYVKLVKVVGKDTATVVNALNRHSRKLPEELYKSLTWIGAKNWPITSDSHPGVLLRPAEPVAARGQREYERTAKTVHAQGHGHLGALASETKCDCEKFE